MLGATLAATARRPSQPPQLPLVVPNDNRTAAGGAGGDVTGIVLEAVGARWKPDDGADSTVTVQAFAGQDGVPRIPGPLLRVRSGTRVRVTAVNSLPDSVLVLHGITARAGDSVRIARGERRVVEFTAGAPGTYLYWATTGKPFAERSGMDGQLTGAVVIDPATGPIDERERIFVITTLDVLPDTTKRPPQRNDIFDQAINGRSWPHTEVIPHELGDTVRWRWVSGSYISHPMHLHGFHYEVLAAGRFSADTTYDRTAVRTVVTELMRPGGTMRMRFVPTRPGRWLFHCHFAGHITPFPDRPDSVRAKTPHEGEAHARESMSGLAMGIDVAPRRGGARPTVSMRAGSQHLRLLAQERRVDSTLRRGFVLDRGGRIARDSVSIPGTPLVLTRGVRAEITVVNRLSEPTTIHWHGMELEGYFDGVVGWSGVPGSASPMVMPNDSFTVAFTPPRAGTFIYHTHLEEERQLDYGMFGAMLVLEPGERLDPDLDRTFILGEVREPRPPSLTVNGRKDTSSHVFTTGQSYRLRFIDITRNDTYMVTLARDSVPAEWVLLAKDGARVSPAARRPAPSRFLLSVGETYDFIWRPREAGEWTLLAVPGEEGKAGVVRFIVRAP